MIDKGLSTKSMKQIDTLQVRMDLYVDKLCGMAAGTARDFLKSKLKADYIALKDIIKKNNVAESAENTEDKQYEVYDRQTGKVVGKPYSSLSRASRAVDRLDNKYGGYRYGKRPVTPVTEARPNRQTSTYNPDSDTYNGEKMPTLRPDPADNAEQLRSIASDPLHSYDLDTDSIDAKKLIAKYMKVLLPRHQDVIKMRFMDGMTLEEVAKVFGVHRERIRQIEASSLRAIRREIDRSDIARASIYKPVVRTPSTINAVELKRLSEVEELDELSVNTLKSYFGKSGKDAEGHIAKAKAGVDKESSSAHAKKRMSGMKQAVGKLSKARQRGEKLSEAVHKLPLTPEDFEMVKRLMEKPIPAIVAPIYISEIINDDELNDQFTSLEETDPGRDIRPLIVEWLNRVMPDQMYRFGQAVADETQRKGLLSPIHGYDDHQYKGTNNGTPGNATGRF
jgi:RNA polymerase sigma factor (sigma-70 family)